MKFVIPSVSETAFNCPHCGVLTTQYWFRAYARQNSPDSPLPNMPTQEMLESIRTDPVFEDRRAELVQWVERRIAGEVFLDEIGNDYANHAVANLNLTKCYNCKKLAIWRHEVLIFPPALLGISPNEDLSADVQRDFNEARAILDLSPRGAAALLRLAVQKLCAQLGEKGRNIDDDIASLVKKGLDARVQKALDIVRVIGNEAVHPGELDLSDDRDTALQLFELVNSIAQQMITHPRQVEELYGKLPEGRRAAIERRDLGSK